MIERATIENYRCLRSVSVPLKALTVLIGPNNTGKTSFLSALGLLKSVRTGPPKLRISDHWMKDDQVKPSIVLKCGAGNNFNLLSPDVVRDHKRLLDQITPVSCFYQGALAPKMTSPGASEAQGLPQLNDEASNLPAYLDSLLRHDRSAFDRVIARYRDLIPGFSDLSIPTPKSELRRIDIKWDNGLPLEADLASDGVKLIMFFAALVEHPDPPKLILIEEPENGVHPSRLQAIMDQLIGLTEGRFSNHKTQVILTTHSPYLLDCVDPEKHMVLVSRRNENGAASIDPINLEKIEAFRNDFMLGEIWTNESEEGLVGGPQQ